MSQISKEACKKSDIETIDKGQYFWLSRRDLQIKSGYSNWKHFWTNVIQRKKNTDMNQCLAQRLEVEHQNNF